MFQNAVLNVLGSLRTAAVITQHDPQIQETAGIKKSLAEAERIGSELPGYETAEAAVTGIDGVTAQRGQSGTKKQLAKETREKAIKQGEIYRTAYGKKGLESYRKKALQSYMSAASHAYGMSQQEQALVRARAMVLGATEEELARIDKTFSAEINRVAKIKAKKGGKDNGNNQ